MFWLYKAVEKILVLFRVCCFNRSILPAILVFFSSSAFARVAFSVSISFSISARPAFCPSNVEAFSALSKMISSGFRSPLWFDGLQNQGKDSFDDDGYALRVGMDTVGLVEGGVPDHSVEKKGVEGDVMFAGEAGVDGVEAVIIVGTEVARGAHADEHGGHAFLFQPGEDGVEVGGGFVRRKATQGIIGAQFDDDQLRIVGEGPVQTCQATGGGIARDPGVGDVDIEPMSSQRAFQLRRKGFGGGQTQAGGETVAEHGNA